MIQLCAWLLVLVLLFCSMSGGCAGCFPVSLCRHTSGSKRRAKGPVARLVSWRQKTFYYRLLPQPRYGERVGARLKQLRCVAARGLPGAARRAYRKCGRARRRRRHPPQRNPKGRGLLRRGFVERLARIPDTGCAFLLPTPQNPSGAVVQSGPNLLYGSGLPLVSRAKGMIANPITNGMAVSAITEPKDPVH